MNLGNRKEFNILIPLVIDRSSTNSLFTQKSIIICSALCGAKITNNFEITKKNRRKVLKNRTLKLIVPGRVGDSLVSVVLIFPQTSG